MAADRRQIIFSHAKTNLFPSSADLDHQKKLVFAHANYTGAFGNCEIDNELLAKGTQLIEKYIEQNKF